MTRNDAGRPSSAESGPDDGVHATLECADSRTLCERRQSFDDFDHDVDSQTSVNDPLIQHKLRSAPALYYRRRQQWLCREFAFNYLVRFLRFRQYTG